MINLHAIYYRNIWPFEGKECSLLFQQGKFLIKSPIGRGKSFLFFDGPSYALYRTANRNMLNIHSKEGEISLIFSADEQYYLVRRMLKPGKSKDSCSSQLFSISPLQKGGGSVATGGSSSKQGGNESPLPPFQKGGLLQWGVNIIADLANNPAFHLEEIVMKNETDLQQSLDQLLPPKPVFLSTMFLLQDAENIFEMQPADRLTVLKNVFGLLGIDEAKEQVQDKKRELSYKLKALQDQSQQDGKLRKLLRQLQNNFINISRGSPWQGGGSEAEGGLWQKNSAFFAEIEPFLDQITLNDFTLNGLDIQIFLTRQEELQAKEKEILAQQTTRDQLMKQIHDLSDQLLKQEQEKKKLTFDIAQLEVKIASIDAGRIEVLKKEKVQLYEQIALLDNPSVLSDISPNREKIATLIPEIYPLSGGSSDSEGGLSQLYALIQDLKASGKDLANQVQQAELQLKNLELEAKNQQMKIEQLEQARKRLAEFEVNIDQQASFSCEKIWTNCPFIKVINKQHFEQLEKQKSVLGAEIEALEPVGTGLDLSDGEAIPTSNPLQHQIQQRKNQIEDIKTFLTDIDYKSREEKYAQKEALQKQIHEKDQAIMQLESETQKLQDYQQQKTAFQTSFHNLEQQETELKAKSQKLKVECEQLQQHLQEQQPEELQKQLQTLTMILQTIHDIEQLITDATATKNLVKDLQQQEKLLSNLYTILSKEILLIALDEYLPVLSEIINSFLVQVVDYQIAMKITETAEKLELEAKIYDEKGEREVKSLSGGQRTILKLVRMLAISSYLQTPLLFLDETINNLDIDTVGKVSEMLNNFVKQRTMKFYTVTHNQEIQEMDIWDSVIDLVGE